MSKPTANFPTSNPSWDLESIFAGGAESEEFRAELEHVTEKLRELKATAAALVSPGAPGFDDAKLGVWVTFFRNLGQAMERLSEVRLFASCVAVSQADDPKALRMPSLVSEALTLVEALNVDVRRALRGLDDEAFERVHGHPELAALDLKLRELRRDADVSMDPQMEALAVELNRDGLHAWARLYNQVTARLKVEVADGKGGEPRVLSVGQAKNLLEHEDREVRRQAHEGLQAVWREAGPVCASALSSIIGAEQTLYRRRGADALTMPLNANRVQRETIDAIMEAADTFQDVFVEFLKLKARYMGLSRMEWYDPRVAVGPAEQGAMSYEEAQRFIFEHVNNFSSRMGDFCKHALAQQWVEVEDRPGKAQGGFCGTLMKRGEVRIFMTYGGTNSGVVTLAHELGHGYHAWVMRDLDPSQKRPPMGLAETASTLFETLVDSAALERAQGPARLRLLDERLLRGMTFLLAIPARYHMELALHEQRAQGPLDEQWLSEMTEEILTEAFGDGLASVNPTLWASTLHFYLASLPFYNFPYVFGYLFSRAVHARAQEQGPSFVDELLLDTGRMTCEKIGKQYLDADLTQPEFWIAAAAPIREDLAEYRSLVEAALASN